MTEPKAPAPAVDGSLAPSSKSQTEARQRRWWESGRIAAFAGAIAVLVAPVTTWLASYGEQQVARVTAEKQQELELRRQEHNVRMEFFNSVVNPSSDMSPEARIEALRYFKAVLPDGELKSWAVAEYDSLVKTKAARDQALKQEQEASAVASEVTTEIEKSIDELDRVDDEKKKSELKKSIDEKTATLKSAIKKAESAASKRESAERVLIESVPSAPLKAAAPKSALTLPAPGNAMAQQAAPAATPLLPVPPKLSVGFGASRTFLHEVDGTRFYRFSVRLRASAEDLNQVARVDYFFDHASLRNNEFSSRDRASKFQVSYTGWGCVKKVEARLTLIDGNVVSQSFDMCAAFGD